MSDFDQNNQQPPGYEPPPGYQNQQAPPPSYQQQPYYQTYESFTRPVGLVDAYKAYWTNYVNFNDRTSRAGFWWVFLVNVIISAVLSGIAFSTIVGAGVTTSFMDPMAMVVPFVGIGIVSWLWNIVNIIPCLSITIRRLHDTGRAWPYIFIALIPFVGVIILIVLCASPSKLPHMNQFGELRQV